MSTPARRDRPPTTTPRTVSAGLAVLGLVGVIALLSATFVDVIVVQSGGEQIAADSGYDRHSVALVLLAVAALVLTMIAMGRGSRTAAAGLALVGAAALLLAIVGDVPDLGKTGDYERVGLDAATKAGGGFYLETAGGAILLVVGGLLFLRWRAD